MDKLISNVLLPDGREVKGIIYGRYYTQTYDEPGYFEPNTEDTALELYWEDDVELSWLNDERTQILNNGEELDVYVFNQVWENGTLERDDDAPEPIIGY